MCACTCVFVCVYTAVCMLVAVHAGVLSPFAKSVFYSNFCWRGVWDGTGWNGMGWDGMGGDGVFD